jgi:hypothetical protein
VDGGNNMVACIDELLENIAQEDAIPYIIAEIPTNPRVEVPDLIQLRDVLSKERKTTTGALAIAPVFILDQTFCPNVHFLGENNILSTVRTIAYVSGSKFPSGGKCTAGYLVSNEKAKDLMEKIELHLKLCDNEATPLQIEILAKQLPSMNQRIQDAYKNTREFVNFISETLPEAKINFVSEELAQQGFTPSVFSLDLPTKGNTHEEKEAYKRELNLKLINLMITEIPTESKYCVSYGQLKGCYWTIPATSTQGTTKEGDKDYNYFKLSFGKRPADELYDLEKDPDCVNNIASDPQYASLIKELKTRMETDLRKQKDPRVLGKGDVFDYYPQIREEKIKKLYKDKYYSMFDKFFEKFGKKTVPIPSGFVEKDGEN